MSGRAAKLVRRWKPVPAENVLAALKTTAGAYSSAAKREFNKLDGRSKGELRRQVYKDKPNTKLSSTSVMKRIYDAVSQAESAGKKFRTVYLGKREFAQLDRDMPSKIVLKGGKPGKTYIQAWTLGGPIKIKSTTARSQFRLA